jgi:peptide/nickel transport system permease protein
MVSDSSRHMDRSGDVWFGDVVCINSHILVGIVFDSNFCCGFPSLSDKGGLSNLRYLLLPSLTLAAPNAALIVRLVRASMLDVSREDHVRTARAKGLSPAKVAIKHVFRNSLIAVAAAFGFTFAALISEAVVTETVFSLPGIGRLVVQSILRRDYPVIQGVILVIVVLYMVVNLLVDLAYARLDPRVSLQ